MSALQWTVSEAAVDDDAFALGIVRLSPTQDVLFVNRAAKAMVGDEMRVGMNLATLPLDAQSQSNLGDAMDQRFKKERGTSYRIVIHRRDLDTRVRLLISAVPEYDPAGKLIGSIGFFVDETIDVESAAIHEIMKNAPNSRTLLTQMAERLHNVINFDSIVVAGISEKRQHLVRIFEDPPGPVEISPTKWWPMPPFVKAMIENFEPGPQNLGELLASPQFDEYAKSDPGVEQFRERGFRYDLRIAVHAGGHLVATVSLMRRACIPFTALDYERCSRLPIVDAVKVAMAFEERRDLQFGFKFIRDISAVPEDSQAVAQKLVDQLAAHHEWDHVSLFRIDKEATQLKMICQANNGPNHYPEPYCQPVSVGLIGQAYSERKSINVGDVRVAGSPYHRRLAGTLSEMVLQVPGTDGHWLLNVESTLRDAFADDEQQLAETQLQVAGFILERMAALEQKSAIFRSVADAVIQTNDLDVIVDANPAATELLGRDVEELQHRSLAHFIAAEVDPWSSEEEPEEADAWKMSSTMVAGEPGAAALARAAASGTPLPVNFQRKDGALIPVLMSAAALPERLGGKVYVASDLRTQNLMQRMEGVTRMFHQLASEIRIPLVLADAFLSDASAHSSGAVLELIDKSLRQLRKADMPLERLMRAAVKGDDRPLPRNMFDLHSAVEEVVAELPSSDAEVITLRSRADSLLVSAPRHELLFCVRSLLAFLVRRRSQVENVEVRMGRRGDLTLLSLALPPLSAAAMESAETGAASAELELELAEPVIKDLMHRMGGSYAAADATRRKFRLGFNAGH